MPDPPSFEFTIFERIEEGPDRSLILQERYFYYRGRTGEPPQVEEDREIPLPNPSPELLTGQPERLEYCRRQNSTEFLRAVDDYEKLRERSKSTHDAITARRLKYHEWAVERLRKWFEEYHVLPPRVQSARPAERKRWTGTKSEFARFIDEEYQKNRGAYRNRRVAAYRLYDEHEFQFDWTKEKCYGLVRKV